jgi:hypothetical protein
VPSRSRLTVRAGETVPLARRFRVGESLAQSRAALLDVQAQLDALLAALRAPEGKPDEKVIDRLHRATRRAGLGMSRLVEG